MVKGEAEDLVGEKLPLPQLHLHSGTCTYFHNTMFRVWPKLAIWGRGKWKVHSRHGGGLDGANSSHFLKKLELLAASAPPRLLLFIRTLLLFRKIVDDCFSWELCQDYSERISAFTASLRNLIVYCKVSRKNIKELN